MAAQMLLGTPACPPQCQCSSPRPVSSPASKQEVTGEDLSAWVPDTHTGDVDRAQGSWLQPGPAQDAVGTWRVS